MNKKSDMKKVLDLCIKINGVDEKKKPGTPAVFYHYDGHVNWLYVAVYKDGWAKGADPDARMRVVLDHPYREPGEFNRSLGDRMITEVIEYLEGLL